MNKKELEELENSEEVKKLRADLKLSMDKVKKAIREVEERIKIITSPKNIDKV